VTRRTTYTEKRVDRIEHVRVDYIACDKCSKELDPDDDYHLFPNELRITLNEEACVNDRVRMDLCVECLKPIWAKICEAIGADPEAGELRIGEEDD
jgi:hypothetical protein